MPAPSTIKCDIDMTGELKMVAFDAGVTVSILYWTIHKKVCCVAAPPGGGAKVCVIGVSPKQAIEDAASKIYGGL